MARRGSNGSNKRGSRSARAASKARERDAASRGFKAGVWRWTKRLAITGTLVALLAVIGLATAVFFASRSLPSYASLRESQTGQTILVRARDGTQIVELGPSYGQWLAADEIPDVMKQAMVSVEDHRFNSHFGVDPMGLARAVFNALSEDRQVSATSTITQQLARNVFLNSNRTLDRKLREAVLAMALEWRFSKEQILELYLNKVYFGGGAYGIDSASRKFFSHSARELSLEEAAIIAGLVKAPSRYSPTADVDAAVSRANVVVGQMVRYGGLDPAVARQVNVDAVKLCHDRGPELHSLFHRLGAAAAGPAAAQWHVRADRGVDHAGCRDAARRHHCNSGQCAGRSARRTGQPGP